MSGKVEKRNPLVPQDGVQKLAYYCPAKRIFYGGARGGGKSHLAIMKFHRHLIINKAAIHKCKGLVVRQHLNQLDHLISIAHECFRGHFKWKEAKKLMQFDCGARLIFSYMEKEKDAHKYQGDQFSYICVDEVGEYPTPEIIRTLQGSLRMTAGMQMDKTFLMTGNPGGVGHSWLKREFYDPAPKGFTGIGHNKDTVFIPSSWRDNPILMQDEPEYVEMLKEATKGQPHLRAAWIDGRWDIVAGAAFSESWDANIHILPKFDANTWNFPLGGDIFRSYDWGWKDPFSVGWYYRTSDEPVTISGEKRTFPPGTLIRFGELYGGVQNETNKGVKWHEHKIVAAIKEYESQVMPNLLRRIDTGVADHDIFTASRIDGVAPIEIHEQNGLFWDYADKKSRVQGWAGLRNMLEAAKESPMESPGIFFCYDTCKNAIAQIPVVPLSKVPGKENDVDTRSEDHIADEVRYAVMAEQVYGEQVDTAI